MVSPTNWMKRLGVSGRLVAFFKAVCVYFAVGGAGGAGASPGAVAAKCAPVLCLLLIVLHRAATLPPDADADAGKQPYKRRRYALLVSGGLALSALGDALLALSARLEPGMAAFAGAHVAYLAAFGRRGGAKWRAAAALGAGAAVYASAIPPHSGILRTLVPLYAFLLAAMCWRGVARGGPAKIGALLFLVSDAVLGYNMFVEPLPYGGVIVMSTYYLGQLGIALSALEPYESTEQHRSVTEEHENKHGKAIQAH